MREIKFRVWHKQEKKIYEVSSIRFGVQHGMARGDFVDYVELDSKSRVYIIGDEVDPLQFTGLLDKNGKEIYEGDIIHVPIQYFEDLRFSRRCDYISHVWFDKELPSFQLGDLTYSTFFRKDLAAKYYEIIGNIWENPELLEEQQSEPL